MIDEIVVDVEIAKTIEEVGGWDHTESMGVSCAVVYEHKTDRFRIYGPDDVEALRERLLAAERITGFNTWAFDFAVIWGLPRGAKHPVLPERSNDILRRIWIAQGFDPDAPGPMGFGGNKLDDIVKATLGGVCKIGNGADAPKWWKAGQVHKVINYCVDDVALERDLGRFVDRHGFVINGNGGVIWLR